MKLPRFCSENSNFGFTLVEILLVLGICAIGALFFSQSMVGFSKSNLFNTAVSSRNELLNRIWDDGGSSSALAASAALPGNATLAACMGLGGTCNSWVQSPMILYPRNGSSQDAISGVPGTPRRYSLTGVACPLGAPASAQCPIEVTTSFAAQCKVDTSSGIYPPASCASKAEVIEVFFTIQQTPGIPLGAAMGNLQPFSGSIIADLSY